MQEKKETIFLVFNIIYDIRIALLLFTAIHFSNSVEFHIFGYSNVVNLTVILDNSYKLNYFVIF